MFLGESQLTHGSTRPSTRGTSLIRNTLLVGPYNSPMPGRQREGQDLVAKQVAGGQGHPALTPPPRKPLQEHRHLPKYTYISDIRIYQSASKRQIYVYFSLRARGHVHMQPHTATCSHTHVRISVCALHIYIYGCVTYTYGSRHPRANRWGLRVQGVGVPGTLEFIV